jgi:tRNA(fMet)-specific endonuclease VapC
VVTSAIAYAEVMRKVPEDDPIKIAQAEAIFRVVTILPFDAAAARAFGAIPFKRGTFDRLIAAHARALGLIFITNNERDFTDVAGLKIENWARS